MVLDQRPERAEGVHQAYMRNWKQPKYPSTENVKHDRAIQWNSDSMQPLKRMR